MTALVTNLAEYLRQLSGEFLDAVLPRWCVGCQSPVRDRPGLICEKCWATFETDRLIEEESVRWLRGDGADPQTKLRADSAYRYRPKKPLALAIQAFKHGRLRPLLTDLAGLARPSLLEAVERLGAEIVVPVPLHWTRQRWRGFNQATMLGEAVLSNMDVPVVEKALTRQRMTKSQGKFTREARQRNVENAFRGDIQFVSSKRILLIDDVLTTGATVLSCAEALKDAGAREVTVWTLASPSELSIKP